MKSTCRWRHDCTSGHLRTLYMNIRYVMHIDFVYRRKEKKTLTLIIFIIIMYKYNVRTLV